MISLKGRSFLTLRDFTPDEIDSCVEAAYADGKFSSEKIAPVVKIDDGVYMLELWKGPTCAFKDMALQLLPHLLAVSSKKAADGMKTVILVATSGDTGKAALEGFKDVPDTKIMVFYPNDGVSPMQKLQMVTQEGKNVAVCAIQGNFDDAQSGVKSIFTNEALKAKLRESNMMFSSANSINWGRLVPQIVYYVSAYCDLLSQGQITLGQKVNFVVPTGNFGNILAAYYAKLMGVPVNKLVCASNINNVLTEFLTTGYYNREREFHLTVSPSMDILISSNLERLLYLLCGCDDKQVRKWMGELSESGHYRVPDSMLEKIRDTFAAGCCDEDSTLKTISDLFNDKAYLCDTHTAVGAKVCLDYKRETGDDTPCVIASTASPFKFSRSVLHALGEDAGLMDEFSTVSSLAAKTGLECPAPLAGLKDKKVRFTDLCTKDTMQDAVLKML